LVLFTTLLMAFGQFFEKKGADSLGPSFFHIITNPFLILGAALYIIACVLYIVALKSADLSLVFPLLALNFVWVVLLGFFFLSEPLLWNKSLGVFFIIAGVASIGKGGLKGNSSNAAEGRNLKKKTNAKKTGGAGK
ncbi:MAG: hypothetical protein V1659_01010, partial [Candidatus Woesearchaeota archaeon]